MPRSFNGSTSNYLLDSTNAPVAQPPCTFACWYYVTTLPTTAGDEYGLIGTTLSSGFDSMYMRLNDSGGNTDRVSVTHRNSVVASENATADYTANAWHHAAGVFTSNSSRTVYQDGANSSTDTQTVSGMSDNVDWFIGAVKFSSVFDPMDGEIAHAAVWDVALTEPEIVGLANGVHPMRCRPGSLVAYTPLYATETGTAFVVFGDSAPSLHLSEQGTVGAGVQGNPPVEPFFYFPFAPTSGAAAVSETLVADTGTITITGVAADLDHNERLVADQGTITVTGQAADLLESVTLTAETGSITISGQAADLDLSFNLIAEQGTITLTGQDANLNLGELIIADTGSYTWTGLTAELLENHILAADQGTITVTGQDADLRASSESMDAETGAITLTGQSANLLGPGEAMPEHQWDTLRIGIGVH